MSSLVVGSGSYDIFQELWGRKVHAGRASVYFGVMSLGANDIVAGMYTLKETAMKNDASARPKASQAPARLSKGDFVTVLRKQLQEAEKAGEASVDVRAANLHTEVGVYPARGHSMPTCCTVMYEEMQPGDEILLTPPGGKGPTLLVRYKFPR